jgi:Flp pilus assembly protein protease CpaA
MVFFSIILVIGILTTFTDLKSKKIYNQHLIIGAILGLIATAYTVIFSHEPVLFHIVNGLVAFLIGLLLHKSTIWRGGDAKLFALYAFLMPVPTYNHILFPGIISLFANSFISGMIILLPIYVKDIIINHKVIVNDLLLPLKRQALFYAIGTTIYISWTLYPVYYLARTTNPVIILTVLYLIFNWGYTVEKEVQKHYIIEFFKKKVILLSVGIAFGLIMRLWLSPNSLSYPAFTRFIIMITLSSVLSTCIHTTFNHFKDYQERVPFAPLLLMGCILSYTPFLTTLMHMVVQWNVLLYR